MGLTSFPFFLFLAGSVILYYLVPGRWQWKLLLMYSFFFFLSVSPWYCLLYPLVSVAVTTYCGIRIEQSAQSNVSYQKRYLISGIAVNLGILLVLKYGGFFSGISTFQPALPIGLSFYTLTCVAYLTDVSRGVAQAERNYGKTALYIIYYPLLTSGPVLRRSDVGDSLFTPHTFSFRRVAFGLQRILWGVCKKLVPAAYLGTIVDTIFSRPEHFPGIYLIVATFAFMGQLYADFSGCMDIIIGASECYGIILPENFRRPFAAESVREYWQRWHISLGTWARDYILLPVLRTKPMLDLWKKLSKKYGKKTAQRVTSYLAMLIVWLAIGFWHGAAWKYILGMGLWFWGCIVLEELTRPCFDSLFRIIKVRRETRVGHIVQSARVLLLVAIGNLFFRLSSVREVGRVFLLSVSTWNPQDLLNGTFFQNVLSGKECVVALLALFLMHFVSKTQEIEKARTAIDRQHIVMRFGIWIALIVIILVFGEYGPEYDAAAFIYQQF